MPAWLSASFAGYSLRTGSTANSSAAFRYASNAPDGSEWHNTAPSDKYRFGEVPTTGAVSALVRVNRQPVANRVGGLRHVSLRVERVAEPAVGVGHVELRLDVLGIGGGQRAIHDERLAARVTASPAR
jgi:hypothetical protein